MKSAPSLPMSQVEASVNSRSRPRSPTAERLKAAVLHAAHSLPAQGPITVFVHHNTLHTLEELPFHEAVVQGGRIYNCQPYLTEERYRRELERGRIRREDLQAVLQKELGKSAHDPVMSFGTRLEIRLAMLEHSMYEAQPEVLRWFVAETNALVDFRADAPSQVRDRLIEETRHWVMRDIRNGDKESSFKRDSETALRDRATVEELLQKFGESSIERWSDKTWEAFSLQCLWRICRKGVHGIPSRESVSTPVRHRDLLLEASGEDIDRFVNELLIRFCGAFLDQGFSNWRLPQRERGFFAAFRAVYGSGGMLPDRWLKGLQAELERLEREELTPLDSLVESLNLLGVTEAEWEEYLTSTLLALRGWAGMIWQLETRGDRVAHPAPPDSLLEYLAIRLILERLALKHFSREWIGYDGELFGLREALISRVPRHARRSIEQRAFQIFQLAQILGWAPPSLQHLSKHEWEWLVEEVESFTSLDRRRVFQVAYERRYRSQVLDALALHAPGRTQRVKDPQFQVVCCIDDREESFARHLEELSPKVETFSIAGFFGVPMYYRGAADAHFIPQCPIVVRPRNWVVEDVVYTFEEVHRRRARARRALGAASHQLHVGSRTVTAGAIVSAGFGILASIPLVMRVLLPRLTARIRRTVGRLVQPPPVTQLQLERFEPVPSPHNGGIGFSVDEMVESAERVLRDLGLTSGFGRIVLIVGHGSNSLNNPHNSAYNCGACAGTAGAPNARAFAQIANDPRVRERLAARGIRIPEDTLFVGGYHNTCDDSVTFFDLDRLPRSHQAAFEELQQLVDKACDRNAHERCRRFQSAPLNLTFSEARRHVESRSEDLSQTRPECGHATNAWCIVGRRSRTRGLFLDRRVFLNSYDPTQDDSNQTILERALQAAVPVCAGISLEYYFSYVDSTGWGCGTKLPHNVASLLGVMNGAASDLRTGLPWQMVEIHEPMRLLFVVETTAEAMLRILERNEAIGRLCRNEWVQLAVLHPETSEIQVYSDGQFHPYEPESKELPRVKSSVDWYRGWRDHLGCAVVESALVS